MECPPVRTQRDVDILLSCYQPRAGTFSIKKCLHTWACHPWTVVMRVCGRHALYRVILSHIILHSSGRSNNWRMDGDCNLCDGPLGGIYSGHYRSTVVLVRFIVCCTGFPSSICLVCHYCTLMVPSPPTSHLAPFAA